jgi:hypothetical protein
MAGASPLDQRIRSFIDVRMDRAVREAELNPDAVDGRTLNLLSSLLDGWARYYGFLCITLARYEEGKVPYVNAQRERIRRLTDAEDSPASRALSDEEYIGLDEIARLAEKVHLDIETFHLNAKILLDRIAVTCRFYFWRKKDSRWTHVALVQNLENVCHKKGFLHDPALFSLARDLGRRVVHYRDKRIAHVQEPRLNFGTSIGPDGRVRICPIFLYPEPGEAERGQIPTEDLPELMELIEQYVHAMLDLFEANAGRSVLPPPVPVRADDEQQPDVSKESVSPQA